jgi:hypothetical protein
MKQAENLVSSVEKKIRELAEQHARLKKIAGEQKEEIDRLTQTIINQKKEIKVFEDKIRQITIARITENKEGVADAKKKISELVREIDKCIGLLSS